ncbi:hypothetical protein [Candidatus Poriferisodalis sp.]|uniref:hypothetical protein n=1 Tax=Candidatus Poriferisodalis sp. TaxID=3101277 RepID=UPI003B02A436
MLSAAPVRVAALLAAVLLAAVLLAAGCSEPPPEDSPAVPPQLAPAPGYDAGVFTLGVLMDLGQAEADRAALAGVQAYWAGVNARGGVAGLYRVELSVKHRDAAALGYGGAPATTDGDANALGYGDASATADGDAAALGYGGAPATTDGDANALGYGDASATADGDAAALGYGGASATADGDAAVLGYGGASAATDGGAGASGDSGAPATSNADATALREWDIAALAYVSSAIDVIGAADPAHLAKATTDLPLPVVPAVATLAGEDLDWVLTSAAPVELTTVALLDRFRASGPGAAWCVIVDRSPLGRQVAAAAYAAGAARETVPAMLDLDVGEIEVLDLDASVFEVADAVSDRQCRYVLVETAEANAIDVLERLPPSLTVARRSTLAAGHELPRHVELLIDPAPPWQTGRSAVTDAFAADWARLHNEWPAADARVRAGWLSQLRLHLLLEQAVAAGDVSRERLVALAGHVEPVDPDRNTLPGVPRIGMDIAEPIGGGPLRTLRLYGRSEVAADDLGLRQVLALDVTHLAEELRNRLGPASDLDPDPDPGSD